MNDNDKKIAIRRLSVTFFAVMLLLLTVLGFILPLRPEESQTEKRKLSAFPDFSVFTLLDGSYFSDIGLWFSDTFPLRDTLIEMNNAIGSLLGTDAVKQGFNEGVRGDDIPEAPTKGEEATAPEDISRTTAEYVEETDTGIAIETTAVSESVSETTAADTTSATQAPEGSADAPVSQQMGNIFVSGNAGYEYYNFVKTTADNYVTTVNAAASVLNGKAKVYDIIIPTSMDIILDENIRAQLSVSDQKKAIDYMYGCLSSNVTAVNIYDTLVSHRDEYLYFRTDHHWTGLAAYYAYREFCFAKGITPLELTQYTLKSYDGFLGSFYNDSGMSPALAQTPDRVDTYCPPCNTVMTVTDKNGDTAVRQMLYDATNSKAQYKYSAFIYGDNPFSVIENTDMASGESCLLIKESFGNAFAPYLSYHYKYVYVVDYRYWEQTIGQMADAYKITDVIYCNNISMTRSATQVEKLADEIG